MDWSRWFRIGVPLIATLLLAALLAAGLYLSQQSDRGENSPRGPNESRAAPASSMTAPLRELTSEARVGEVRNKVSANQLGGPAEGSENGMGATALAFRAVASAARSGDRVAACRLAVDLTKCANRLQSLTAATQISSAMGAGGASTDDRAIGTVAAILNSADVLEAQCRGVTAEMLDQAFDMQRIAAEKDKARARWLASNPYLNRSDFLSDISSWLDYKSFAQNYFRRAEIEKDLEDLPSLLLVYFPGETMTPRPPYRNPDEARFLALYEVAVSHGVTVPADIVAAATQIRSAGPRSNVPAGLREGWSGEVGTNLSSSIAQTMFPQDAGRFCN